WTVHVVHIPRPRVKVAASRTLSVHRVLQTAHPLRFGPYSPEKRAVRGWQVLLIQFCLRPTLRRFRELRFEKRVARRTHMLAWQPPELGLQRGWAYPDATLPASAIH